MTEKIMYTRAKSPSADAKISILDRGVLIVIKSLRTDKRGRFKGFEGVGYVEVTEVYRDGLYPNRFIVENKKAKYTWGYPMRFS